MSLIKNKNKSTKSQRAARAMFMRRSYAVYKHMASRLKAPPYGIERPFALEDLRGRISLALNLPCVYCGSEVTAKNFSADHRVPLNRADEIIGPGWLARLDNIAICCSACQRLKGAMDEHEYRRFLALLSEFDELARRDTTRRLRAGGAVIRCGIARP